MLPVIKLSLQAFCSAVLNCLAYILSLVYNSLCCIALHYRQEKKAKTINNPATHDHY